jgi:hypothetical protein
MKKLIDENTVLAITPSTDKHSVQLTIYLKVNELDKLIEIADSLQLDEFIEKYPLATKYLVYVHQLDKYITGKIISLHCSYYKGEITKTIQFYLDHDNTSSRLITINVDDTDLFSLVQPT